MGAGIVMLREGFEASLILGIVLAFMNRTGRRDGFWAVWAGALVAIAIALMMFAFRLGNHFPTPLKSYAMACLGMRRELVPNHETVWRLG